MKDKNYNNNKIINKINNPLTQPGEEVSVFISPYLSAGAPALGEAKGIMIKKNITKRIIIMIIKSLKKVYLILDLLH